jgi:mono/diheme cytochrome c family protein
MQRSPRHILLLLILLLSTAIFARQTVLAQTETEPPPPETIPDGEAGSALYQNRCANCHGAQGLGDGELAPNSAVPPTAFADPEYMRRAVPVEMFNIITNGIMGDFGPIMPAFGPTSSNPISNQNRWDLIASIYGLGTPPENISIGETIFAAECAECHTADDPIVTDPAYWFNRSNQDVFTVLNDPDIAEHTYTLGEDDLWLVVDYARTFSYLPFDPLAALAPIEAGTITGAVLNLTDDTAVVDPLTVTLNAFSTDFQPILTQTTILDEEGAFQFTVAEVAPDLIYVTTLEYAGVPYGSDFGQLERNDPTLALPVSVYETTTDDRDIVLDQVHIILSFADGAVQVNELYQFGNNAPLVYMGPNGIPGAGTVEIVLPAGAQDPQFTRTFGSLESFVPANNLLETGTGWADVTPVRPGRSTLNLLVSYILPYDNELTLAHPINYQMAGANLVMPQAGVEVSEEIGGWIASGVQTMNGEAFQTYTQAGLPAGSALQIGLDGRPQVVPPAGGSAIQIGDTTTEQILVGAGILLLVVGGGLYYVSLQRQRSFEAELDAEEAASAAAVHAPAVNPVAQTPAGGEREQLLQAIAQLDQRYAAGEVDEASYQEQREALIGQVAAIWNESTAAAPTAENSPTEEAAAPGD